MRRIGAIIILAFAAIGISMPLLAQQSEEEQKSLLLRFVEDRLSTPDRQISISGLQGVLSEDVSVSSITISDQDGVWLRINNAQLNWNQGALLTGRLQINSLNAQSIDYLRQANESGAIDAPSPEAREFEVPEFPVAINIDALDVPRVTFGEGVFGLDSEIGISGNLTLEGGSLDTQLDIERHDGPGGSLNIAVNYDGDARNIDLALGLNEPENGVVANLLNIDGRPAISMQIEGSGQVDALEARLTLDANGERALEGTTRLGRSNAGTTFEARLDGPISDLMAAPYRPFFGAETEMSARGTVRDAGGLTLDGLTLSGGQLSLQAAADTTSDWFLSRLRLDAEVSASSGEKVVLPVSGADTLIGSATLSADYGESEDWQAELSVSDFENASLSAEQILFDLSGVAQNLSDANARRVTFNGDGRVSGISAEDPAIADALGDQIGLGFAGLVQGNGPLQIAQARIAGKAIDLSLEGEIEDMVFDGQLALATPSLTPFSGLAGRQLSGAIDVSATGTFGLLNSSFDLVLDGDARELGLGMQALDQVLAGEARLNGRLARDTSGFMADDFTIQSPNSEIYADGNFSSTAADFDFRMSLDDLALISEQASGRLEVNGTATGQDGPISLGLVASVASGTLMERTLRDAQFAFEGALEEGNLTGDLDGTGFLGPHRVSLGANIASTEGSLRLSALDFNTVGTRITGDLERFDTGLINGALSLDAEDISTAAALLLTEAGGAVNADISLSPDGEAQAANVTAAAQDLVFGETRIGSANIDARATDLFGVPAINGTLDGADITAGGIDIATLSGRASQNGDRTSFDLSAELDNQTIANATGALSPEGEGYQLALETLNLAQGNTRAALVNPTRINVAEGNVRMDDVLIDVAGGRISISGSAGDALNLSADITALPLSIANTIRPDLGLGGTVNGQVRVTGPSDDPVIAYDITANGVNAAMLASYGVTPIDASASGQFTDGQISVSSANVSGPRGLSATIEGRMPLVGSNGALDVTASVPLALAQSFVSTRGTQLSGTVDLNAQLTGSIAELSYGGSVSISGGQVVDPQTNLRLQNISGQASLSGQSLTISSLSGNLATGGSVSAGGSISLAGDMPADISITLNSARYADGNLFVATGSGTMNISGPLRGSPMLSGDLLLERAEISIPEIGPSSDLLDVNHIDAPFPVRRTLRYTAVESGDDGSGGSSGVFQLDITVRAPNQVFVRGRGVDAELGGQVRLQGNVSDIQPVGGFELIRGRLDILGQRVNFNSGRVTLVGDLDPYVDLDATTDSGDVGITVNVSGTVSDLDITFSSDPELPQDEVLSLLIFDRALADLSPLQLARLAAAAAELSGSGGDSVLDSLREATGLDDLDVVTDDEGNTAVRAGTYLQDNVYLGVQAGSDGQSEVSIDLDVTDTIKLRGATGNEGETSLGVFYEEDF